MSFKPMIQTHGDDQYYPNATAFATREEAELAAKDIFNRWMLAVNWRVDESDEPVNYRIECGVMFPIESALSLEDQAEHPEETVS